MNVEDEKLMAFADGELSPDERKEIERALAADEGLRRKVEAHRQLRQELASAFDGALQEPVPVRLRAAAEASQVVHIADRRAQRWSGRNWGAMAASLAAGLLLGVGLMRADGPLLAVEEHGLVAQGALARALETQLAADAPGAVRIGLTFRARDNRFCRTFELMRGGMAGLACKENEHWTIAMAASQQPSGEVRMAAAPEVMAAVDALIEGEPLDAAGEARARDGGWR